MLLNIVEDIKQVDGETHLVEHVVVFANLLRMCHANNDVFGDSRVVSHEVWEFCWTHVDMVDHLFVCF